MAKKVNSTTSRTLVNKSPETNTAKSLKAAESQLAKAQGALAKAATQVTTARDKAQAAAEKAKKTGRANFINAANRAKDAVAQAMAKRQEAVTLVKSAREALNEAKQQMRIEEKEQQMAQRKEVAKQKAVTAFIKQWEREWSRKTKAPRVSKQNQVEAPA